MVMMKEMDYSDNLLRIIQLSLPPPPLPSGFLNVCQRSSCLGDVVINTGFGKMPEAESLKGSECHEKEKSVGPKPANILHARTDMSMIQSKGA